MADIVDPHAQVVDHRRNPATIAGFRQAIFWYWSESVVPKSGNFCRNLAMSGHHHWISAILCQISTKLVGI
jgi:hypothetical protein